MNSPVEGWQITFIKDEFTNATLIVKQNQSTGETSRNVTDNIIKPLTQNKCQIILSQWPLFFLSVQDLLLPNNN